MSGKRRKRRGGSERAAAGSAPVREREAELAVAFTACVSVRDVRTAQLITCRLEQRCAHSRTDGTKFSVLYPKRQTANQSHV